jgi:hypothetical protein
LRKKEGVRSNKSERMREKRVKVLTCRCPRVEGGGGGGAREGLRRREMMKIKLFLNDKREI